VLVWGAQCENGAYATSYTPTTTIAVARAAETATFPAVASVAATGSWAAWVDLGTQVPNTIAATRYVTSMGFAGRPAYLAATGQFRTYDGTSELAQTFLATPLFPHRFWTSWGSGSRTITDVTQARANTGAFDGTMETTNLEIGSRAGAEQLDGIMSRVCVDPDPSRCR
jgi:hypothetical protein